MRLFIISLFLVFCSKGFSAYRYCTQIDNALGGCLKDVELVENSELEAVKTTVKIVNKTAQTATDKANTAQNGVGNNTAEINKLANRLDENQINTNTLIRTEISKIRAEISKIRAEEIASLKEEFRIYKDRSACPPCVILPANTESEMKKKYHCFKTGIEQWERSEKNFDNKCIGTLVGHIKQLPQLDDGDWFGEDEINYILDLAARYPSFLRIK